MKYFFNDFNFVFQLFQVDLCRCLYKLHFQLLLILDSFTKMLRVVAECSTQVTCSS
jgi:hypothetical protein